MKYDPIEDLASQIEPLAASMANLADDLRVTMEDVKADGKEQQNRFQEQGRLLIGQFQALVKSLTSCGTEWKEAAKKMQDTSAQVFKLRFKTWLLALLIGLLAAAPSVYTLYRLHWVKTENRLSEIEIELWWAKHELEKWEAMQRAAPEKTQKWIQQYFDQLKEQGQ